MYVVNPNDFKTFIDKMGLVKLPLPVPSTLPCIIEFKNESTVMAKVEVTNYAEFTNVVKHGKVYTVNIKNKYWIRGQEWKTDKSGKQIQELII